MYSRDRLFIGGKWEPAAKSEWIDVVSPSTEEIVGRSPCASGIDVDNAVEAARAALHGPWASTDLVERIDVMCRASDLLASHDREIAELLASENGSPMGSGTKGYIRSPLKKMKEGFPANARQIPTREIRHDAESYSLVAQEPIGVVGAIIPWNTAFGGAVLKVVPALLAGCPVVLKPSPLTPLDPFYLAEALAEAGLPEGMLSVLPGGGEVGEAIVSHPGVDMITFTGSSAAGARIAATAGEQLKRVVLECGGKSAGIVLEDADLDQAIHLIAETLFHSAGQYCRALTRVLAPRSRYDEVVSALCDAAAGYRVGDPFDPTTTMGPLVSSSQRDRVEQYVQIGIDEGAKLALGGRRPSHLERGWYFEPTVFHDVNNQMRIAREEIFGPVVTVIAYDGVDEAVSIANDSDYGLTSVLFTTDAAAGLDISMRLEAGLIGINAQGSRETSPAGGRKLSGLGLEHGLEGQREIFWPKSVILPEQYATELIAQGIPMAEMP